MTVGGSDERSEATLVPEQAEPIQLGIAATLMLRIKAGDDKKTSASNIKLISDAALELLRQSGQVDILRAFLEARGISHDVLNAAFTNAGMPWEKERPPEGGDVSAAFGAPATATLVFKSARADTFKMTPITWLWPDRFAIGKLGIIAGLPDEGKGQILCDMAARITRGNIWPCGAGRAPLGNVVHLSAEDDPNDTIVPRLAAAGADLSRIELVSMVQDKGKARMFSLITDLPLLKQKIEEVGDVRMVQIDPISAYLGVGKVDSCRTTDVRAVLAPLVDLALETRVSIIGIMHFNKKVDVTNALLRISDSLAFGATARHVFAAVDDPENKRKLFVRGKNNLARKDLKALAYNFGIKEVQEGIWAPHIDWHLEPVDVTATEAMQAAMNERAPAARDDAKKFLEEFLQAGPMPQTEVMEAAKANLIAEKTLRRAKTDIGIKARKKGNDGGWTWELPTKARSNWRD
jgi:putative DNA primase/helicase